MIQSNIVMLKEISVFRNHQCYSAIEINVVFFLKSDANAINIFPCDEQSILLHSFLVGGKVKVNL